MLENHSHPFFTYRRRPFRFAMNEWGEPMWLPTFTLDVYQNMLFFYFRPHGELRITCSRRDGFKIKVGRHYG